MSHPCLLTQPTAPTLPLPRAGRLKAVDVKPSRDGRGPAYAFLEFEEPRDAEDAVRGRDGHDFGGQRLRVEGARGNFVSASSRGPPRRSGYRVRITGLPQSASWQVRGVVPVCPPSPPPTTTTAHHTHALYTQRRCGCLPPALLSPTFGTRTPRTGWDGSLTLTRRPPPWEAGAPLVWRRTDEDEGGGRGVEGLRRRRRMSARADWRDARLAGVPLDGQATGRCRRRAGV